MIVMKFGGSSVADAERIKHVAEIIKTYREKRPVVVLSAMGDTTDYLLESAEVALTGKVDIENVVTLHKKTIDELSLSFSKIEDLLLELNHLLTGISMIKELTKKTRDYLVSFGERLSVRIMSEYLNSIGVEAKFFDAWDVGIISDSNFMSADLLEDVWTEIPKKLSHYVSGKENAVPIVTGFIAKDKNGKITTLGRGGSDLTATILGSALNVEEIQTWKDVDGILTTDPRVCKNAKPLSEVTYEEAQELALFGAQVLHPRSMIPCIKTGVPVRVKNSYNIQSPGTLIVKSHTQKVPPVCAITSVKNVSLIDIVSTRMLGAVGFLAHIFNQFLKWNISIDVIATSEVSVSLTVNGNAKLDGLLEDLKNIAEVSVHKGKSIVSIICDALHSSSILATGFDSLSDAGINVQMMSQGASKVNISMIVDNEQSEKTVQILHKAFFE
ncbi:MAG: aspartate kinase [Treponema sp.]|nr:aspartate kinase [Treponema sp.]